MKSCYIIDHIVESQTLKAQYIGMYIVLSLMAKCKKLTLCSDPSFAYLTCVHIRHIGSSNFEKFFLFVYSPYYLRVEHTNLLSTLTDHLGWRPPHFSYYQTFFCIFQKNSAMATLGLNETGKAGKKEGERKGKDRKITKWKWDSNSRSSILFKDISQCVCATPRLTDLQSARLSMNVKINTKVYIIPIANSRLHLKIFKSIQGSQPRTASEYCFYKKW